jgi:hypothetical protein
MRRASRSWRRSPPRHLWEGMHWSGRACKVYERVGDACLMTMHSGLLDY